jgi:hypothetical protein
MLIVVQSSVVNGIYVAAIYNDLGPKVHPQAVEDQYWASSAQLAQIPPPLTRETDLFLLDE